jgi:tetratricopeptide (TPR) repeat protein
MNMHKKIARFALSAVMMAALAVLTACGGLTADGGNRQKAYYISGSPADKRALSDLFSILENEYMDEIDTYFTVREIGNILSRQKQYAKLINFFCAWVDRHPGGQYNAYYLLAVADAYIKIDAYPVASIYFDMIVKNYPDLIIRGKSIHLESLKQLIELTAEPAQKIWYYEELLSRFSEDINAASTYFLLGKTYEELGEWGKAIENYTQFLPFYMTAVAGYPNAYTYARQLVDFNNSRKNWGFESLPALLGTVKAALDAGDIKRLWQYRAMVNFFARSWAHESDDASMAEFNLSTFATSNKIRYDENLEPSSNANEAYLRTSGWSTIFTPIWYLYFRKIYFPPDPEVHGKCEWAGIYYGERF